jgi:hypothetical protein
MWEKLDSLCRSWSFPTMMLVPKQSLSICRAARLPQRARAMRPTWTKVYFVRGVGYSVTRDGSGLVVSTCSTFTHCFAWYRWKTENCVTDATYYEVIPCFIMNYILCAAVEGHPHFMFGGTLRDSLNTSC